MFAVKREYWRLKTYLVFCHCEKTCSIPASAGGGGRSEPRRKDKAVSGAPKMPYKSTQPVTRVPSTARRERWAGLSTRDGMRSQAKPRRLQLEPKLLLPRFAKSELPGRVLAPGIGRAVSPPDSTSLRCRRYRRCRAVAKVVSGTPGSPGKGGESWTRAVGSGFAGKKLIFSTCALPRYNGMSENRARKSYRLCETSADLRCWYSRERNELPRKAWSLSAFDSSKAELRTEWVPNQDRSLYDTPMPVILGRGWG